MSQRAGPGNTRKRGHQHHPRNDGNRRRAALQNNPLSSYNDSVATCATTGLPQQQQQQTPSASNITAKKQSPPICDKTVIDDVKKGRIEEPPDGVATCVVPPSDNNKQVSVGKGVESQISDNIIKKRVKEERNRKIRKPVKSGNGEVAKKSDKSRSNEAENREDMSLVFRPAAEGSSFSDQEEDPEMEELARLRCTSERTEVVAERETRRRGRRCADYPGLAFASSIFSSDTLMKFAVIRNELHNIMNTQLKRVGCEGAGIINKKKFDSLFT